MDLRERVEATYKKNGSSALTAAHHDVSESWVRRLIQCRRETGSLKPRSSARTDDQRAYDDKDEAAIRELIKQKPDATLAEVAEHIGKPAGKSSVWRTLVRLKLVRKKSPSVPPSRTGPTSRPNARRGSNSSPTTSPPT